MAAPLNDEEGEVYRHGYRAPGKHQKSAGVPWSHRPYSANDDDGDDRT
jgi:hypothetical protein